MAFLKGKLKMNLDCGYLTILLSLNLFRKIMGKRTRDQSSQNGERESSSNSTDQSDSELPDLSPPQPKITRKSLATALANFQRSKAKAGKEFQQQIRCLGDINGAFRNRHGWTSKHSIAYGRLLEMFQFLPEEEKMSFGEFLKLLFKYQPEVAVKKLSKKATKRYRVKIPGRKSRYPNQRLITVTEVIRHGPKGHKTKDNEPDGNVTDELLDLDSDSANTSESDVSAQEPQSPKPSTSRGTGNLNSTEEILRESRIIAESDSENGDEEDDDEEDNVVLLDHKKYVVSKEKYKLTVELHSLYEIRRTLKEEDEIRNKVFIKQINKRVAEIQEILRGDSDVEQESGEENDGNDQSIPSPDFSNFTEEGTSENTTAEQAEDDSQTPPAPPNHEGSAGTLLDQVALSLMEETDSQDLTDLDHNLFRALAGSANGEDVEEKNREAKKTLLRLLKKNLRLNRLLDLSPLEDEFQRSAENGGLKTLLENIMSKAIDGAIATLDENNDEVEGNVDDQSPSAPAEVDQVPSTSTPRKRSDDEPMVPLQRLGFRISDYFSLQEETPLPAQPLEHTAGPELVDLTADTDDEAVEIQEDLQNIAEYIERQLEEENQ